MEQYVLYRFCVSKNRTDLKKGFYLWPKVIGKDDDDSGNHPRDLFGVNLEKLNIIRRQYSVWITWDAPKHCLKVLSQSRARADMHITDAIMGIRQAVRNANAEAQFASPLYIVDPPEVVSVPSKFQIDIISMLKSYEVWNL